MNKGQIMKIGEHKEADKVAQQALEQAKKAAQADKQAEKQVRIQVYTTDEKHRAFKMACAGDGVKMTDKVDELITAYLKSKGITIE